METWKGGAAIAVTADGKTTVRHHTTEFKPGDPPSKSDGNFEIADDIKLIGFAADPSSAKSRPGQGGINNVIEFPGKPKPSSSPSPKQGSLAGS
jgi:hypothetical protein